MGSTKRGSSARAAAPRADTSRGGGGQGGPSTRRHGVQVLTEPHGRRDQRPLRTHRQNRRPHTARRQEGHWKDNRAEAHSVIPRWPTAPQQVCNHECIHQCTQAALIRVRARAVIGSSMTKSDDGDSHSMEPRMRRRSLSPSPHVCVSLSLSPSLMPLSLSPPPLPCPSTSMRGHFTRCLPISVNELLKWNCVGW